MNTYYKVIGTIDGTIETLYAGFERVYCVDEMDAERTAWEDQGYRAIKIVLVKPTETLDAGVYTIK